MRIVIILLSAFYFTQCNSFKSNQAEEIDLSRNSYVGEYLNYANFPYDSITKDWQSKTDSNRSIHIFLKYPLCEQMFIKTTIDTLLCSTIQNWFNYFFEKPKSFELPVKNLVDTFYYFSKTFIDTCNDELYGFLSYEFEAKEYLLNPFPKVWIIKKSEYSYTGGAHGYYYDEYFTFIDNKIVNIKDFIKDTLKLQGLLVEQLKRQSNAPLNKDLSEVGFFVNDDNFPLTSNFYFTKDTFFVSYNPYEIASFADGIQRIGLPLEKVKHLIKTEYLDYLK